MGKAVGAGAHRWKFYRAGGVDQVRLDTGADLWHLDELDPKLWVALSCPVKGLEFDERTLAMLDTDHDGRVRVPEVLGALRWLKAVWKAPDALVGGKDGFSLAHVDGATPEGQSLLGAARLVAASLRLEAVGVLTVGDAMRVADVFAAAKHNGDGVVPPATVDDAEARAVAEAVVATFPPVADRSGKPGFDAATLDAFFAEAQAHVAWWTTGAADRAALWPAGDATPAALDACDAVRAKVDDWFQRSRLAAFDPRAQAAVNRTEEAYLEVAAKDFSVTAQEVAHFPLAIVEAGRPLPLVGPVNPAWADALERLRRDAVLPLLGARDAITAAEWAELGRRLAPHRAWRAARVGDRVAPLGVDRLRAILAGGARATLSKAIEADLAVAAAVSALEDVERMARLHRDLHRLLLNFVSFTDFYAGRPAVFQAGTLHLDGRACALTVPVHDGAKHGSVAGMSRCYLAYVDCSRPSGEKMTIAAAMTAGDKDNLFVGRNGLFFDRRGRDWDATVSKVVDNPISVSQAFWAPYKKLLRWIEETVARRASAADDAANARLQAAASPAVTGDAAAAPAPAKGRFDVGALAAIGLALSAIMAAVGGLMQALFDLGYWMPIGLVGLVLAVSGPAMLIAWMKLRQRNLGPILDANGWAVNTLTRINIPLGRALTTVAALPPGAERSLVDPYAEKRARWPWVLLVLALLAGAAFVLWKTGYPSEWWSRIPAPTTRWFR
ncbi:MAG: hypothetical protein IT460_06070 [Planctomycetes bacterium]|nr:hypothetical protein [Planctomycetota bacterium]